MFKHMQRLQKYFNGLMFEIKEIEDKDTQFIDVLKKNIIQRLKRLFQNFKGRTSIYCSFQTGSALPDILLLIFKVKSDCKDQHCTTKAAIGTLNYFGKIAKVPRRSNKNAIEIRLKCIQIVI